MLAATFFLWLHNRLILRPLRQLASVANQLADDDFNAVLPPGSNDEMGLLVHAFGAMRDKRRWAESELLHVNDISRTAQIQAEHTRNLLHEAVNNVALGFTIYDKDDRLVLCNEAYLGMYESSRDLIVPGATFEDIVRKGALRGQYPQAQGNLDQWVRERVRLHQHADGSVLEQQLDNGRWLMIIEYRTPSGYIVGNRVDITELKRTTDELRQRSAYQRATLDNLPFQFWLKDADGYFLAVNKVFSDAYHFPTPDALVGLTDFDTCDKEKAQQHRTADQEVMARRQDWSMEESTVGADGQQWHEVFRKPVIAVDGSLLGTVGFSRDITERKRMVHALAASEQRWTLAVRGANDGIWDWDPQRGTVFFSDRWKSMLGYASEEITEQIEEWSSRIHPDDYPLVMERLQRHLRGESAFYQSEHRLRCKDGSYKWILDRGQALFDENGLAIRMAGSHTDVTERREATEHIRDRNEQLDAIFALSPDGFVSFDRQLHIKYANPAFLRMTGFSETMLVGLEEAAFSDLLAAECREQASFPRIASLRASKLGTRSATKSAGATETDARHTIELKGPGQKVLEVRLRISNAATVSQ
ncbi:MAG: PAS domain S-box protein, partial [Rhodoferax sp.]